PRKIVPQPVRLHRVGDGLCRRRWRALVGERRSVEHVSRLGRRELRAQPRVTARAHAGALRRRRLPRRRAPPLRPHLLRATDLLELQGRRARLLRKARSSRAQAGALRRRRLPRRRAPPLRPHLLRATDLLELQGRRARLRRKARSSRAHRRLRTPARGRRRAALLQSLPQIQDGRSGAARPSALEHLEEDAPARLRARPALPQQLAHHEALTRRRAASTIVRAWATIVVSPRPSGTTFVASGASTSARAAVRTGSG